jgi:hypothetical protein
MRTDVTAILDWRHLEQLDTLSLVPDAWGDSFAMIADSRMKLSRLSLSLGNFSPPEVIEHCVKLFKSPPLSELVSLRLRCLPAEMGPLLGRFPLPPKVTSLWLSGQLRDPDVSALSRTDAFRHIRHLALCGEFSANLGDSSALALARATGLEKLESLDLSNSNITDRGAEALVDSEELSGLRRLNLERSKVGLEMRESLRKRFRGKLEI